MVNADKREEMQEKNRETRSMTNVHKKSGIEKMMLKFSEPKMNMQTIFLMNLPLNKQWKLVETVAFILLFLYLLFWRGGIDNTFYY